MLLAAADVHDSPAADCERSQSGTQQTAALLLAIEVAVERQGGDPDDVDDLAAAWRRVLADSDGRVDRLRLEAANPRCTCRDGGQLDEGGQCERCYGRREVPW